MFVVNACRGQRAVQCVPIEVRKTTRSGEVPHIDHDLDLVLAQQVNELLDRSGRVSDGPDFERASGHGPAFPAALM
jgi:hypothetical protein